MLPGPQVHWAPAQFPVQSGLLASQSTGQFPPVHLNPHSAPAAQVHWAPSHSAVQVLPGAQYAGQLPVVHSRSQVQPAGQVQSPPFWQVSSQQLPGAAPGAGGIARAAEAPDPGRGGAARDAAARRLPFRSSRARGPPALDVVAVAPPAPEEADSDANPRRTKPRRSCPGGLRAGACSSTKRARRRAGRPRRARRRGRRAGGTSAQDRSGRGRTAFPGHQRAIAGTIAASRARSRPRRGARRRRHVQVCFEILGAALPRGDGPRPRARPPPPTPASRPG